VSGDTSAIFWWAKNVQNDCNVKGSNGDGGATGWKVGDGTTAGTYDAVNASTTASHTSSALSGQSIFTLHCTGIDNLPHEWTVQVNPSPTFEEQ
jgi:hypothetical protein